MHKHECPVCVSVSVSVCVCVCMRVFLLCSHVLLLLAEAVVLLLEAVVLSLQAAGPPDPQLQQLSHRLHRLRHGPQLHRTQPELEWCGTTRRTGNTETEPPVKTESRHGPYSPKWNGKGPAFK